jgi:AbrB family looped-hinge helix DNA binding protein
MTDKTDKNTELPSAPDAQCQATLWKVESLIGVDERGQMVIPKDVREKAKIRPGDKLALVSCDRQGEICCLYLIKADQLAASVKGYVGLLMKDAEGEENGKSG